MTPHGGSGQLQIAALATGPPAPPSLNEDYALRLALGAPYPRDWRKSLEVSQDDFTEVRLGRSFQSASPAPGGMMLSLRGEAPPLEKGSAYVQDPRDLSRFKAEPVGRVRRVFKAGKGRDVKLHGSGLPCCSAMIAAVVDPDAAQLSLADASDVSLLELGAATEKSRAMVCMAFFTAQSLLAGLSLAALLLVLLADPGEEAASLGNATTFTVTTTTMFGLLESSASLPVKHIDLGDLLAVLEPGLGRVTIALAEFSLVGSLLQVLQARDRLSSSTASSSVDTAAECDVRRRSTRLATTGTVLAVANFGVVACCLAGSRPEAMVASEFWEGPHNTRVPWPAGQGRSALLGRSVLSLFALAGALVDVQDRVSVRLSWILGVADCAHDSWQSQFVSESDLGC